MDLFSNGNSGSSKSPLNAFTFDPQRSLKSSLSRDNLSSDGHIPQEFVSQIVKAGAGTSRSKQLQTPLQLQHMAEAALGMQKLKDEKAAAVQQAVEAQAKIARLEAEKLQMKAYFEQQRALVEEQEEMTQQLLEERADIDAEMAKLIAQRKQVASDRARLLIEMSQVDGERAALAVQRLELRDKQSKLDFAAQTLAQARSEAEQKERESLDSEAAPGFLNKAELSRREEELQAARQDLEVEEAAHREAQLAVEALKQKLDTQSSAQEAELKSLKEERDALKAERKDVEKMVQDLREKREEMDAERESLDVRWALLDKEQTQLSRQQGHLAEQVALLAQEWASIESERSRLEGRETDVAEREAAVQKLEAAALNAGRSPSARILTRGDSPRDLEYWRSPLGGSEQDFVVQHGSRPASEIDSLEEVRLVTDSAASVEGYSLCKERAAALKEERLRLWAAHGDPEVLDKTVRQLQEREAQQALKEMQLEMREATLKDQDRRFEAGEMMREWALNLRETALTAKEKEFEELQAQETERAEESLKAEATIEHLKQQLLAAMQQCGESERDLRAVMREKKGQHSWARRPDCSIFTPLRHRGMSINDFYTLDDSQLATL